MKYRIEFVAPTTYAAFVEAESESAARQAFIDGDVDEIEQVDELPDTLDGFTSTEIGESREES